MTDAPPSRRATLVDVARAAGVDKAVVSRLVNGDQRLSIRPETRARVQAAIDQLNYVPNATARTLRTAKSRTFGLLIPDFANPVYAEIIIGAEEAAAEREHLLMTASTSAHSGSAGAGPRTIHVLDHDRIDGLLIAGGDPDPRELQRLTATGLPWLTVNNRIAGPKRWVAVDDELGASLATAHLISLGHRRIAHIAGPQSLDTASRRVLGYRRALKNVGIPFRPELVVHADYTPAGGAQAAALLLRHQPTAYFAANVTSAVGAIGTLSRAGLRIPHDVSVAALHDHALAQHLVPSLTTVRMPLHRLGRRAVELLFDTRLDDAVEEIIDGVVELVVRESTARPPTGS